MKNELLPYLEALNFLKDWSTILLIIASGLFAILLVMGMYLDKTKLEKGRLWLSASLAFFALSTLIALNVIGTIPWSTQRLPELVGQYHDIYQFPNYAGVPIWIIAFGQHTSFIVGMICIVVFLYISFAKRKS